MLACLALSIKGQVWLLSPLKPRSKKERWIPSGMSGRE